MWKKNKRYMISIFILVIVVVFLIKWFQKEELPLKEEIMSSQEEVLSSSVSISSSQEASSSSLSMVERYEGTTEPPPVEEVLGFLENHTGVSYQKLDAILGENELNCLKLDEEFRIFEMKWNTFMKGIILGWYPEKEKENLPQEVQDKMKLVDEKYKYYKGKRDSCAPSNPEGTLPELYHF